MFSFFSEFLQKIIPKYLFIIKKYIAYYIQYVSIVITLFVFCFFSILNSNPLYGGACSTIYPNYQNTKMYKFDHQPTNQPHERRHCIFDHDTITVTIMDLTDYK